MSGAKPTRASSPPQSSVPHPSSSASREREETTVPPPAYSASAAAAAAATAGITSSASRSPSSSSSATAAGRRATSPPRHHQEGSSSASSSRGRGGVAEWGGSPVVVAVPPPMHPDNGPSTSSLFNDDDGLVPGGGGGGAGNLLPGGPPGRRRAPFLSLRPRLIPALAYFVSLLLYGYLAGAGSPSTSHAPPKSPSTPDGGGSSGGNGTNPDGSTPGTGGDGSGGAGSDGGEGVVLAPPVVSASFQSVVNALVAVGVVCLKPLWVPNPKDDVLASLGSFRTRARRFGFVGCAWFLVSVTALHVLGQAGPIPLVCIQAFLPLVVLLLVRRFSSRAVTLPSSATSQLFTTRFMGYLGVTVAGVMLFAGALVDAASPGLDTWSLVLACVGVVAHGVALVWMEKYMVEVETDPWVLSGNVAPIWLAVSLVSWAAFDRSLPVGGTEPWLSPTVRTGALGATTLVATAFLAQHISSFALALLTLIVKAVFVLFFWQTRGLSMHWYGAVGLALLGAGLRFMGVTTSTATNAAMGGSSSSTLPSGRTAGGRDGDNRRVGGAATGAGAQYTPAPQNVPEDEL